MRGICVRNIGSSLFPLTTSPVQRGNASRIGAILRPGRLVGRQTFAQFVPRNAFASVELGQPALNLGADGFSVFLKPGLAFALYFQGIEEHIFHGLERTAMQTLLNERLDFRTFYFNTHVCLSRPSSSKRIARPGYGQPEN